MSTRIDPRERLMRVGQDLLDVIFKLEQDTGLSKDVARASALPEGQAKDDAVAALVRDGGLERLVERMQLQGQRDRLLREYVAIRETIEALLGEEEEQA